MATPNEISEAAERVARYHAANIQPDLTDCLLLAVAYTQEKSVRELTFEVNHMADIERAVCGHDAFGRVWPDWVYEARQAVNVARQANPAWLPELMTILGWQGGTVHQALNAVRRLVENEKDRKRKAG